MNTRKIILILAASFFAGALFTIAMTANGALLRSNSPSGLLAPLDLSQLILNVASPFKVGGSATSTITGDSSTSTIGGALNTGGALSVGTTTAPSTFNVFGSQSVKVRQTSTSTTLDVNDYAILCDQSAAEVVLGLPALASSTGRVYRIKILSGSNNPCTLDPFGDEMVNATTTPFPNFDIENASVDIIASTTSWYTFGGM